MKYFQCNALFLIILSGTSAKQREMTLFLPVNNKPPHNDQIFSIQRLTASQCRYVCMHNDECRVVTYDDAGLECAGYKSDHEDKPVGENVNAWKTLPSGWLTVSY